MTDEASEQGTDDALVAGLSEGQSIVPTLKLGYSNLFCNQRVLHAALSGLIPQMTFSCLEPIMSLRLLDYDVSQATSGLIFGIMPICLAAGTILVPYLVPKWVEPRVTLISALFVLAFATALTGPFFTELNLTAMMIGLGMMGFFEGVLLIPNMEEMMRATKQAYPNCDLEHTNSLLSGLLSSAFGAGMAIGPLLGSFFFQISDFQNTMNYISIIVVSEAVLYILCAQGFQAVRQTCK